MATIADVDRQRITAGLHEVPEFYRAYVALLLQRAYWIGRVRTLELSHPALEQQPAPAAQS